MTTLGESLSVLIGANADPLIQELNRASGAVNKWGGGVQQTLASVERAAQNLGDILGIAMGGTLALMLKNTLDSTAALKDQADQIGLNVEKYQALSFAAQQAGVSGEDLFSSLNRLSKLMGEAQSGVLTARDMFEKWGIAVRDSSGQAFTLEQMLNKVADRINSITDPQLRSAAAFDLLGKNAFALINFLKDGSLAMQDAEQKARNLGAVLDEGTVKNAKAASDQLSALATVIKTNLAEAIVSVLPSAETLAKILSMFSGPNDLSLLYGKDVTAGDLNSKIDELKKARDEIQKNPSIWNGGRAQADYDTQVINELQARLDKMKAAVPSGVASSSASASGGGFTPGNPIASRALDDYLKKLQNLHDAMTLSARDQAVQAAVDQAESIARTQGVKVTDDYIAKVKEAAGANYDLQQKVQAVQQVSRTLADSFSQDMANMANGVTTLSGTLKQLGLDIVNVLQKLLITQPLEQGLSGLLGGFMGGGSKGAGSSGDVPGFSDLMSRLTGSGGGGFLDSLSNLLPTFAVGGRPSGLSIVGEKGPELFNPDVGGTIIPNDKIGGSTVHMTQNLNFSLGVQTTVRAEIMNMLPMIADASTAAVADKFKRGGKFATAMGG